MIPNLPRALVLTTALALTGLALAACGGSSSSSSTSAAPSTPAASAPAAPETAAADAASGAVTYCEPLQAAYVIKPPSGSTPTDEELAAFAAALEPAAIAAQADGRQDLYALFALVAQINAEPDSLTTEQTNEVFTQLAALGPEVLSDCGIDMMQ